VSISGSFICAGTERRAEDPDNVDGEEDEEQAYPLVDELFSRIEELELKVWILTVI
jgi:hypothetical protein